MRLFYIIWQQNDSSFLQHRRAFHYKSSPRTRFSISMAVSSFVSPAILCFTRARGCGLSATIAAEFRTPTLFITFNNRIID